MRTAMILTAVALLIFAISLLVAFFRGLPLDESAPTPRADSPRRLALNGTPPSLRERLKNRLSVCPRLGHQWGISYPLPGSHRIRQCRRCGKVEEPVVVKSYRTERA